MMRRRPPGMVLWRRLREPDVSCVAGELPAFEPTHDCVAVADLPASSVDQVGAPLHATDQLVVEEMFRFRVQWCVDRDDVADAHQRLDGRMEGHTELLFD